jgi:hypothetical protein
MYALHNLPRCAQVLFMALMLGTMVAAMAWMYGMLGT